jgi:hypothetical protein
MEDISRRNVLGGSAAALVAKPTAVAAEPTIETREIRVLGISLIPQLPSNKADALAILDYARWFVAEHLYAEVPTRS